MRAVYDLHCDLLYYLTAAPRRTPLDRVSRCGLPQLRDGGVALQVMALYTNGDGATARAMSQAAAFQGLLEDRPDDFRAVRTPADLPEPAEAASEAASEAGAGRPVAVLAALENAACLCAPDEPIRLASARLDALTEEVGPLLSVSLTWKGQNRFGGGDSAPGQGLTADGTYLLEDLADLGIAIDLSHASDALATDILDFIDAEQLPLPVMASHSNLRAVANHTRNLPDELAQEIVSRGGVVGLNLVRGFVGKRIEDLARHLEHGLALGLGAGLALGTDFFWEGDFSSTPADDPYRFFYPRFGDASCHPAVQELLQAYLGLEEPALEALCHGNARRFIARCLASPGRAG